MADLPFTPARAIADYRKGREKRRVKRLAECVRSLPEWIAGARESVADHMAYARAPRFQFILDTSDVRTKDGVAPGRKDWDDIAAALKKEGWSAHRGQAKKKGESILHVGLTGEANDQGGGS